MVFIDIVGPDGSRTVAVPTADVSVGRGADNSIQLDHDGVADRHVLVIERGGHAVLIDTSNDVTLVNGRPITEATVLSNSCQVSIGPFRLRFRYVELPPDTIQTNTERLTDQAPEAPPSTRRTGDVPPEVLALLREGAATAKIKNPHLAASENATPESIAPVTEPSVVRGLLIASNDPAEMELIRAVQEDEDHEAARLVYAEWLERRGDDSRAHYMRLVSELETKLNIASVEQRRLRSAGKHLSVPWRASIAPRWLPIEACPKRNQAPSALRPCPETWGRVGRGSVDDYRRCASCTRLVRYVVDVGDARREVAQGTPIVVDPGVERSANDVDTSAPPRRLIRV